MRQLTDFRIAARDEDFVLTLESADRETILFSAAPGQIENMIDAWDELLGEADEDDAETYQKPLG